MIEFFVRKSKLDENDDLMVRNGVKRIKENQQQRLSQLPQASSVINNNNNNQQTSSPKKIKLKRTRLESSSTEQNFSSFVQDVEKKKKL